MNVAQNIKQKATNLGFDLVGFASVNDPYLNSAMQRYVSWLESGLGASMDYLKRHKELKAIPSGLLPSVKSIICVALVYGDESDATRLTSADTTCAQVSLYAQGQDYHLVLGERLSELKKFITQSFQGESYLFVDKEPVLERFWAWRSGLGWLGKNTMLINRKLGSFLFLGGLLTSLDLPPDEPSLDHCGRCRKCIEACPTGALSEERVLNSHRCIAFHTIENRGVIPDDVMSKSNRWVVGCDLCQTACPWNQPMTKSHAFEQSNPAFGAPLAELVEWTEEDFKTRTSNLAMARMQYLGFLRNLTVAIVHSTLSIPEKHQLFNKLHQRLNKFEHSRKLDGFKKALEWANQAML